jgi:hypothetical protein
VGVEEELCMADVSGVASLLIGRLARLGAALVGDCCSRGFFFFCTDGAIPHC